MPYRTINDRFTRAVCCTTCARFCSQPNSIRIVCMTRRSLEMRTSFQRAKRVGNVLLNLLASTRAGRPLVQVDAFQSCASHGEAEARLHMLSVLDSKELGYFGLQQHEVWRPRTAFHGSVQTSIHKRMHKHAHQQQRRASQHKLRTLLHRGRDSSHHLSVST